MATPFRLVAMRLPTTTIRPLSLRPLSPLSHIRLASNLANSAKKAPNATHANTAKKLAADPSSSGASAAEVSRTATRLQKPSQAAAASSGQQQQQAATLTWDTFFKLRLQKRRIQLIFSLVAGIGGAAVGAVALQSGLQETVLAQVPLDPFITLGLVVMACGAMGWLLGPILGSQVFYLMNGSRGAAIRAKEGEFLTRVRKNRSDPTNSSAGNPVPDYYGEKIQSVAGYRRWLKDQRAFNKKKTQAFI